MDMVKVTIDGKLIEVPKSSTIVAAAKSAGITIPTLCYLHIGGADYKNDCASCRICVVEVEGRRNLAPACATPVFDGMVVTTNTMKVMQKRKNSFRIFVSKCQNIIFKIIITIKNRQIIKNNKNY